MSAWTPLLPIAMVGTERQPGPLPDFWTYPPLRAHLTAAIALVALVCLHVAAALYHHLYRRDRLLARMGVGTTLPRGE